MAPAYVPATAHYHALRGRGELPVKAAAWLDEAPPGRPASWDRVAGMLLGLAMGDALGNTSESMWPDDRRFVHGEIREYLPAQHGGEAVGVPSDDTQLAFWTLEHLLEGGACDPARLATVFATRRIVGIGQTLLAFRQAMHDGHAWHAAAPRSAGNGALMRIAPALVPHVADPSAALWHDTAVLARLTHNDTASVASCVAFVRVLWRALHDRPTDPRWWSDTFLEALDDLCLDDRYEHLVPAWRDGGRFPDLVRARIERARCKGWDTRTACARFSSSAYLLETVPCVLWILEQHGDDPEAAVIRAVNDTWDNDTVAAIVGAAVGARHGAATLPRRWHEGLSGRTMQSDDGRVQELVEAARERFWERL